MRQTPNEMQITNVIEKERFKYDLYFPFSFSSSLSTNFNMHVRNSLYLIIKYPSIFFKNLRE